MHKKLVLLTFFFLSVLSLSSQEAVYEFKSAIIKSTQEVMGQKSEAVWYIDDYGAKVTKIAKSIHVITINNTLINIMGKTATKTELPKNSRINYLRLTPEVMKKNKIKEEGREEIAGKMCTKYSVVVGEPGREIDKKVWIWKGIALKTTVPNIGYSESATEIQENVTVSKEIFLIPEGVTIQ